MFFVILTSVTLKKNPKTKWVTLGPLVGYSPLRRSRVWISGVSQGSCSLLLSRQTEANLKAPRNFYALLAFCTVAYLSTKYRWNKVLNVHSLLRKLCAFPSWKRSSSTRCSSSSSKLHQNSHRCEHLIYSDR